VKCVRCGGSMYQNREYATNGRWAWIPTCLSCGRTTEVPPAHVQPLRSYVGFPNSRVSQRLKAGIRAARERAV
jgi:hypothetical protein